MPAKRSEKKQLELFEVKVKEVSYRETFNLGNYSSQTIELTAEVPVGVSYLTVLKELKKRVFWDSKKGAELTKHAESILGGPHEQDPARVKWAQYVLAKREKRAYNECSRWYINVVNGSMEEAPE